MSTTSGKQPEEEEEKKSSDDDYNNKYDSSGMMKDENKGSSNNNGDDDDDVPDNASLSSFGSGEEEEEERKKRDDDVPSLLPIISLRQGMQKKATPWAVKSWIALSLTLDGRDKITKVLQYSSRLLAWWLAGTSMKNHCKRFKSLQVALTTSRKAFRLGRSITEVDKLRNMGLLGLILWHMKQSLVWSDDDPSSSHETGGQPRPPLITKVSSNIGWSPSTVEETSPNRRSLYRSLSSTVYRMYRPVESQLSQLGPSSKPSEVPVLTVLASALKIVGLLGFWAGDNTNFLTGSGLFDDYRLENSKRLAQRNQFKTKCGLFANRSYFMGSVAGLYASISTYWSYRESTIRDAHDKLSTAKQNCLSKNDMEVLRAQEALEKAQEKQFSLFLAVLKSCCDVLVFSNNAGIDLHQKYRGKKMHEGFHCVCGLLSASTVLYNNFPNQTKK